jgi:hypothetical protein
MKGATSSRSERGGARANSVEKGFLMRRALSSFVLAAFLMVSETAGAGPPVSNFGQINFIINVQTFTVEQTFVPTFSVLRQIDICIGPSQGDDASLEVDLFAPGWVHAATSDIVVRTQGDPVDCMNPSSLISFKFGGGVAVVPGAVYKFRINHLSGGYMMTGATPDLYPGGTMMVNGQANNRDLVFRVFGSGPKY